MANVSDGYGNVVVERVGQDLKDFLKVVQKDAFYLLFDDPDNIEVDKDGNASFTFGAGGRWNYEANLKGYLEGDWMTGEVEKKAYNKFLRAFKKKDGLISIEYTDSDTGCDWMGEGEFNMSVCEGEILFGHDFNEENITISRFAEANGESETWALEYIYGEDVLKAYYDYLDKAGKEAVDPQEWFETIYEEEA